MIPRNAKSVVRLPLTVQIQTPDRAGQWPARVVLEYDVQDPFAVTITFPSPRGPVWWTFARELLADGQHRPVGHLGGDIAVYPAVDTVRVRVSSPSGMAMVRLPACSVAYFLDLSYQRVPAGTESGRIDWDLFLGGLT